MRCTAGRATAACALAAAFFGCAPERTFVQLPGDIDYVALLVIDGSGNLVRAGALEKYEPGLPPSYAVDLDETLYFAGWTTAELESVQSFIDSGARLESALGCRAHLPAPAFYAKVDGERLTAEDAAGAPPLGAPWLDSACPESSLPTDAILACEDQSKRATLIEESRCKYRLQVPGDHTLTAVFDSRGLGCVESSDTLSRCVNPKSSQSGHELICEAANEDLGDGCSLVFYRTPQDGLYEIATRELRTGTRPYLPNSLAERGYLTRGASKTGYSFDLLPLGDLVLAAVDRESPAAPDCFREQVDGTFELIAHDAETLEPRWTKTVPACLSSMTRDPHGGGFLATYREDARLMIGRFDAVGNLVESATVAADASPRGVHDSLLLADRNELVLVLEVEPNRAIISVDTVTLAERVRAPSSLEIYAIDRLDEHRLAFAADPQVNRCVFDLDAPDTIDCIEQGCLPRQWIGFGRDLFDFYVDPKTRQEIVSVSHAAKTIWACGDDPRAMGYYDRLTQPALLAPHPADDELLMVSGIAIGDRGELSAVLDVLDLERGRILPGTQVLDGMYIARIRLDDRGRIWLLHSWNAKLTRLSLRGGS
jgi:hypothetical protein